MIPTLTVRGRSHWVELHTRLSRLSERVKIGIFSGETEDGDSLPEILAAQEYGTSTAPARPTLGPTIRDSRVTIVRRLGSICGETIRGDRVPRTGLEDLARDLTRAVQHRIRTTQTPPALAESTVKHKANSMADGYSPDKTLIHRGLMVASITWRVA